MSAIQQLLIDHIDIWTTAEIEKKSRRGRAAGNAASVYGIKKLRELILELAVRGKLVLQDTNDKSASELFTCIEAEKTKLIAEGRIKKNKPLSAISDDDQPFPLPLEWTWLRLEDLMPQFQNGASSRGDVDGEAVVVLRLADIKDRCIVLDDPRELLITPNLISKYHLSKNDILIVRVNGSADLVGGFIVCEEHFNGIYCDHFIRMKVPQNIMNSNFLGLIGSSGLIRNRINDLFITTAGQKTVNQGHISSLLVPVPSIAEQHRIVAKVDELMVLCDQLESQHSDAADAHEQLVSHLLGTLTQSQSAVDFNTNWQRIAVHFDTLFTTEASIDALKQALLQLAVMGKLVAQDINDEPASELLKCVQAEKEKLVSEGKIKKGKPFPKIANEKKMSTQPRGWEIINFGEIMELISGQHLNPSEYFEKEENNSIPYITGPADFSDNGPIPTRHTRERRAIASCGDILVTVKGSGVGKINTVYQNELAISRQLMAVRPILVNISFIEKLLLTLAQIFQDSTVGIAIPGISREDVLHAQIALPPLAEQIRIVAKIDELMEMCGQLRTSITTTNQQQKKLADVLVEHAVIR